jgi:phosphoglycolate phosphatase (TIGR01487 family)
MRTLIKNFSISHIMIRVIATDIDGTITDLQRRINLDVIDAFRKVEEKGIRIILVSGNVLPVTLAYKTFIGTSGPVIAENGGILLFSNQIYKYFEIEPILEIYRYLLKYMPEAKRILTDRWRETSIALDASLDIQKIKNILSNFNVRIEATGYGIHITAKEQNKFFGLQKALELMKISPEEVLAFGDSDNDVDMIKNVGVGVAVGNAFEIVKKNAKMVAEKNGGEGVVETLKILGII